MNVDKTILVPINVDASFIKSHKIGTEAVEIFEYVSMFYYFATLLNFTRFNFGGGGSRLVLHNDKEP